MIGGWPDAQWANREVEEELTKAPVFLRLIMYDNNLYCFLHSGIRLNDYYKM
jgi:hypothetical protein